MITWMLVLVFRSGLIGRWGNPGYPWAMPTGVIRCRPGLIGWAPKVMGLLAVAGGLAGCGTHQAGEGVAGRAFVEDEHGNLILAEESQSLGTSQAPVRPSDGAQDWLTEFELTERSGRKVSSQDLKGQPYVVSFFFSTCPTICKRQNEKVQLLQHQFRGQPVRWVSITCDPEVDNPEVLSIYAQQFGADPEQWLFLTGELDYIRRIGAEIFFVPVDRRFHADKFLLVDADGNLFRTYDWTEDAAWQNLLKDIQAMIESGGRLPAT